MESPFPPPPPIQAAPPKSPKVFGILNLVFGSLGVLGLLLSVAFLLIPSSNLKGPLAGMFPADPTFISWMQILTGLGGLFALLQVISGFGLLKARNWARKLAIFVALYAIPAGLAGAYLNMKYVAPHSWKRVTDSMNQVQAQAPEVGKVFNNPGFEAMMKQMMTASGIVGALGGMVYPVLLIFFLTRPKVRVYCIASSSKPGPLIAVG